jgi:hypothetical protein
MAKPFAFNSAGRHYLSVSGASHAVFTKPGARQESFGTMPFGQIQQWDPASRPNPKANSLA